ncbi:hypothetical protein GCM10010372_52280 [Streptomyces tauricus]|nr:hypothetical protein GCM10010372_52280 [Streptomyces tauricus]
MGTLIGGLSDAIDDRGTTGSGGVRQRRAAYDRNGRRGQDSNLRGLAPEPADAGTPLGRCGHLSRWIRGIGEIRAIRAIRGFRGTFTSPMLPRAAETPLTRG